MEPTDIAESIKGAAPILATGLTGVAIATSYTKWPTEFHQFVLWSGAILIGLSVIWAVGGFLGLLTNLAPLKRLSGGFAKPEEPPKKPPKRIAKS